MSKPTTTSGTAGKELSPQELNAIIGAAEKQLGSKAEPDPAIEDPAYREEEEYLEEKELEKALDQQNSSEYDRRMRELERKLEAQTRLIKKLSTEYGPDAEAIAAQVVAEDRRNMTQRMINTIHAKGGYCTLVIHPSESSEQNLMPVTGSVNFRKFSIRRGVPTRCHVSIVENLESQRIMVWEPYISNDGQKKQRAIDVLRHPYQILPDHSPATANAW